MAPSDLTLDAVLYFIGFWFEYLRAAFIFSFGVLAVFKLFDYIFGDVGQTENE